MNLIRIAILVAFVALGVTPVAWGAGDAPSATMTFYHHSIGTCYLENGLPEVAKRRA